MDIEKQLSKYTPKQADTIRAYGVRTSDTFGMSEKSGIKAGYSKATARGTASQVLNRTDVVEILDAMRLQEKTSANRTLAAATDRLWSIADRCKAKDDPDTTNELRAVEGIIKTHGGFITVTENTNLDTAPKPDAQDAIDTSVTKRQALKLTEKTG